MHGHVQTRILAVYVVWKLIISIIIYLDAAMYSTEIIHLSPWATLDFFNSCCHCEYDYVWVWVGNRIWWRYHCHTCTHTLVKSILIFKIQLLQVLSEIPCSCPMWVKKFHQRSRKPYPEPSQWQTRCGGWVTSKRASVTQCWTMCVTWSQWQRNWVDWHSNFWSWRSTPNTWPMWPGWKSSGEFLCVSLSVLLCVYVTVNV